MYMCTSSRTNAVLERSFRSSLIRQTAEGVGLLIFFPLFLTSCLCFAQNLLQKFLNVYAECTDCASHRVCVWLSLIGACLTVTLEGTDSDKVDRIDCSHYSSCLRHVVDWCGLFKGRCQWWYLERRSADGWYIPIHYNMIYMAIFARNTLF